MVSPLPKPNPRNRRKPPSPYQFNHQRYKKVNKPPKAKKVNSNPMSFVTKVKIVVLGAPLLLGLYTLLKIWLS